MNAFSDNVWPKLPSHPSTLRGTLFLLFLASLVSTLAGCNSVSRRLTIHSDPPGALVLVDGEEIGITPASTDFTYYGTREITLMKDGYETLTTLQEIPSPWYQQPPLDFISDNFLPYRVTNRHSFTYQLQPKKFGPTEELLDRARGLRSEAEIGK